MAVSDCIGIWPPFVAFPGVKEKTNSLFPNANMENKV